MEYRYYISYCYRASTEFQGFGSAYFTTDRRIDDKEKIDKMTEVIRRDSGHQELVVLGITLLGVTENVGNLN